MKKRDIYFANLDPTVGAEIAKKRPVLIVSNNINNQHAATVTVLPITSSVNNIYPFETLLNAGEGNIHNDSKVKANQIRTIDKTRLIQKIGTISDSKMDEIEQAILIHLDIDIL